MVSSEDVQSEQAYRESDAVSDVAVSRVCRRPRTDEQTVSRIGLHHRVGDLIVLKEQQAMNIL